MAPAKRRGDGTPAPDPHPFVSMSLFVDITTITVDPSYVAAAARNAAGDPDRPAPRATSLLALGALLAVGGLWGVAAAQTRAHAGEAARTRADLLTRIADRTAEADRLAGDERQLRLDTAAARDARLRQSATGRALAGELDRLELAVGAVAVTGPGLVVTVDDGPDDDPEARVDDSDLQAVVNALWASGAEAVAINDRRISALSAIREAGEAILVDYRPVSAPYVVRAVGDPDAMEPAFRDSATGRRFGTYVYAYGIRFDVERASSLDLPSSETSRLRHARPARGGE